MLLWQADSKTVAAAACTIFLRAQEGKVWGGESYHNMEPMLLNVSVAERLQITSSECHKRCHMHTAATFALADENKMVSKLLDRCSPADTKAKQNWEVHSSWKFFR